MRLFQSTIQGDTPITPDFRLSCYNIWEGGNAGSVGMPNVLKSIDRMGADILSIQEVGVNPNVNIKPLLEARGYTDFYGNGGKYEPYLASKYPITFSIVIPTVDWRDLLYNEVNINGNLIGIATLHLDSSSCVGLCHSPDYENVLPDEPSAQRRCIQIYQIMEYINIRMVANPSLKGFIVQGDYNAIYNELNVVSYSSSIGETLPAGLSYPLANAQFPTKQFEFYNQGTMSLETPTGLGGEIYTWPNVAQGNENPAADTGSYAIDYIAVSDGLTIINSEILNSKSDANTGMEKYGAPLDPTDSFTSSDHLPVFADIKIN